MFELTVALGTVFDWKFQTQHHRENQDGHLLFDGRHTTMSLTVVPGSEFELMLRATGIEAALITFGIPNLPRDRISYEVNNWSSRVETDAPVVPERSLSIVRPHPKVFRDWLTSPECRVKRWVDVMVCDGINWHSLGVGDIGAFRHRPESPNNIVYLPDDALAIPVELHANLKSPGFFWLVTLSGAGEDRRFIITLCIVTVPTLPGLYSLLPRKNEGEGYTWADVAREIQTIDGRGFNERLRQFLQRKIPLVHFCSPKPVIPPLTFPEPNPALAVPPVAPAAAVPVRPQGWGDWCGIL